MAYPSDSNKFTIYHDTFRRVSEYDLRYNKVDSDVEAISNNRERRDHNLLLSFHDVTFLHIRRPVQNVVLFCGSHPFWRYEFFEL